ncbi:MAG TPA: ABC transporter substrate-binding protein [Candidatus Dormibacteraeota bacterium]|nr:ABC transporter substrate-binding protein [Candidatus Dormibacteraeota bacterium]
MTRLLKCGWVCVITVFGTVLLTVAASWSATTALVKEELLTTTSGIGPSGGRLVVALRAEPKTLNPLTATDAPSREVLGRLHADLIHINRGTQKTEAALARSWKVSPDGRSYTLELRRGIRFSDGQPFDADDVVFSFQVYLDDNVHSPQRDLLVIKNKPITVVKIDSYTVRFNLAEPYAAAERLFDSVAILPRHLLETAYKQRELAQTWNLATSPAQMAGLGAFRLKEYVAGQRVVLEKNPYYWKQDSRHNRLPHVNELVFLFVPSEDAQALRFQAGETDILNRIGADNYGSLVAQQQNRRFKLYDLGPGLEDNFLFFNLNDLSNKSLPQIARKQEWFRNLKFRQAVSAAADREGIVRLVYQGRATPLWGNVTPGNRLWLDTALPHPSRSLERARQLLREAGFSWMPDGALIDALGQRVEFTIAVSSSNAQRSKMATIVQDDLKQLGMKVQVVPLDFRALVDRLLKSSDYEACMFSIGSGDADPNGEMNVWMSNGSTHLWDLGRSKPATPWESEMDQLMEQQLTTLKYTARKKLYDRVQEIVAEDLPIIPLASPNILVGAKSSVGNFQPAILDPYTLWNADELYVNSDALAQVR